MNQVLVSVMPIMAYTWRLDLKSKFSIKSLILVHVNVYNSGNENANFWIILNPFDLDLASIIFFLMKEHNRDPDTPNKVAKTVGQQLTNARQICVKTAP